MRRSRKICLGVLAVSLLSLSSLVVGLGGLAAAWTGGIQIATGDVNGDGTTDLGDAVYMLSYLFTSGPAPVPVDVPGEVFDDLQSFASARGMLLDPESVQFLSSKRGLIAEATIDGFDELEGPGAFFGGVDVAAMYIGFDFIVDVTGLTLPAGFYVHRVLFDTSAPPGAPFVHTFLIDSAGSSYALQTGEAHLPGSDPLSQLGVRSEFCDETSSFTAKRYVSCPQLGDILAMTCIASTIKAP